MSRGADDARVAYPLFQAEYGGSSPTSALHLHIAKISAGLAAHLNEAWHSSMPHVLTHATCYPCFGAEYHNLYYTVAMWQRPSAANRLRNGAQALELRRFAIAPDAPRNTASRMLRIMAQIIHREMPHIHRLLSYQDTEKHTGTIYKASGWEPRFLTRYVPWTTHTKRESRIEQSTADKIRWEKDLVR